MLFVVETQFTGLLIFCSLDLFTMFLCVKLCYGPIMLDTNLTTHCKEEHIRIEFSIETSSILHNALVGVGSL